jgi:hypothetical protein
MQQDDAAARIQQADLGVRTETKASDETAGKVIDTEPKPATQAKKGETVTLMVSEGPQTAPENPAAAPQGPGGGQPDQNQNKPPDQNQNKPPDQNQNKPPGPGNQDNKPPPPKQIAVPSLKGSSVEAATAALERMGLKAKTAPDPVHSNAVGDGKVLSSEPKAATKVDSGSEVTLTVAKNTPRVNLIDLANTKKATWTATGPTTEEKLTFGTEGTTGGLVRKQAGSLVSGKGTLDKTTLTTVLVTRPPDKGLITGEYKLDNPIISGDHVKALVGLVNISSDTTETPKGEVVYTVEVNGRQLESVTVKSGTPQQLDANLSKGEGAKSIKIIVTSSGTLDLKLTPVWQGLRLEPTIGE